MSGVANLYLHLIVQLIQRDRIFILMSRSLFTLAIRVSIFYPDVAPEMPGLISLRFRGCLLKATPERGALSF